MSDDIQPESSLAATLDELVEMVGETKQAVWSAATPERREAFDLLMRYLAEQAALISDAEMRAGGRPGWELLPSGQQTRNILGQAADDPDRVVELLMQDLNHVVGDVRARCGSVGGEYRQLLAQVADGLEARIGTLSRV